MAGKVFQGNHKIQRSGKDTPFRHGEFYFDDDGSLGTLTDETIVRGGPTAGPGAPGDLLVEPFLENYTSTDNLRSKNSLSVVAIAVAIFFLLFAQNSRAENVDGQKISRSTSADREHPKVYYYEGRSPKEFHQAQVSGADCSNLIGNYEVGDIKPQGVWAGLKWTGWENDGSSLAREEELRKAFREKPPSGGKFFCFPYVDNITHYLETSEGEARGNSINLKGGPILIHYDGPDERRRHERDLKYRPSSDDRRGLSLGAEWISGRYMEIKSISKCLEYENEFYIKIDFYQSPTKASNGNYVVPHNSSDNRYDGNYRAICWECDKAMSSPQALQKSILFFDQSVPFFFEGYAFEGGFMIPERALKTVAPSVNNKKIRKQYVDRREKWQLLRSLAEKENNQRK